MGSRASGSPELEMGCPLQVPWLEDRRSGVLLGAGQAAARQEGPDGTGLSGRSLRSCMAWFLFIAADFLGFRFLPGWTGH